jgi:hypothetical protein
MAEVLLQLISTNITTLLTDASSQFNFPKEFQQISHGLEACDEDWEKRHDGLKKIQELIKKGAGDNANFYPLFEKQIQKLLLHQVSKY